MTRQPQAVPQREDDADGRVPAAVSFVIVIGAVGLAIGWLALMHMAGQGRWPW